MRKTGYLFQRRDSANWHIRLQFPGNRIEKSLGTPDRRQAELLALPMIAEHKAKLLAARPRFEPAWAHRLEPGREHIGPDGERIIATDRELIYLDSAGAFTRTEPNGGPGERFIPGRITGLRSLIRAYFPPEGRPKVATKNGDDAILETYLTHKKRHRLL